MFSYKFTGIKPVFDESNVNVLEAVDRVRKTKTPEIVDTGIDCVIRVLFNEDMSDVQLVYYRPSATYKPA